MISKFINDKITVIRPRTFIDSRNKKQFDYIHPEKITNYDKVSLQPSTQSNDLSRDDSANIGKYALYFNNNVDVQIDDEVIGKGLNFKVLNPPQTWTGASGKTNHKRVYLEYFNS
jgi:hypothetical protein